jgi:hypothetical protein
LQKVNVGTNQRGVSAKDAAANGANTDLLRVGSGRREFRFVERAAREIARAEKRDNTEKHKGLEILH